MKERNINKESADLKSITRDSRDRTLSNKQSVKHAVFSVDLIDRLIRDESEPKKLSILKKLRKEAKKVWHL